LSVGHVSGNVVFLSRTSTSSYCLVKLMSVLSGLPYPSRVFGRCHLNDWALLLADWEISVILSIYLECTSWLIVVGKNLSEYTVLLRSSQLFRPPLKSVFYPFTRLFNNNVPVMLLGTRFKVRNLITKPDPQRPGWDIFIMPTYNVYTLALSLHFVIIIVACLHHTHTYSQDIFWHYFPVFSQTQSLKKITS
jgi:hypothetical protein